VPAATVAGGANHAPSGPPVSGGTVVPFFYGTNQYVEKFAAQSQLLAAAQVEAVFNVNPGGFMRGVRLEVRSTGGVIGTGVVAADGPWTALASATLENIDGSPIQYPMSVYAHMIRQWFARPWHGDPSRRFERLPSARDSPHCGGVGEYRREGPLPGPLDVQQPDRLPGYRWHRHSTHGDRDCLSGVLGAARRG